MKITFGLSLDGFIPSRPDFNHLYCGPDGLATNLELRLGIASQSISVAKRLSQYMKILESAALGRKQFYSDSLSVDRWGAASTLLSMRDELRMAGWDGTATQQASKRIQDLASVESIAIGDLLPGLPDRIEEISKALSTRSSGVSHVECIEPAELLPFRLRCLLEQLGYKFEVRTETTPADPGTNLLMVQKFMKGGALSKGDWRDGEDSVVFATAFSELTLAHAAAQLITSAEQPTLISTASSAPLGGVLNITQDPSLNLDGTSPSRPILQVLRLALELRWAPPDPASLLQFLSHSVSPLSRQLRSNLADAVADCPGIGSLSWVEAIQKTQTSVDTNDKLTPQESEALLLRITKDLQDWIDIENYSRQLGAPGSAIAETALRVKLWAQKRALKCPDEAQSVHFKKLAFMAGELAEIVGERDLITPDELATVLELISGNGQVACDCYAELGSPRVLTDPGAAIEPAQEVIWLGFEQQKNQVIKRWSTEELRELKKIGVHLSTAEDQLALARLRAVRPFFCAQKRLILLWPRIRGGEAVEPHPIYTILCAKLGSLPIRDLDQDEIPLQKVKRPVRPLPSKQRWMKISNPALLASRPKESYSSLSKFALKPFEWVFHYKAKLRTGSLMEINLLTQRGNLLHRVVEKLLEPECEINWLLVSIENFNKWIEDLWSVLLKKEGANFLLPGSLTGGQRLLEDARRSVWALIVHMKQAGVINAVANVPMEPVSFETTSLAGIIDLEIKNGRGKTAIVDLKFGQGDAKRKELQANTALQLAVYGKLVSDRSGGTWPDVAYYILRTCSLLAQDRSYFPAAESVTCTSASYGPKTTWESFVDVWKWRRNQLDSGWIEIPLEEIPESHESTEGPSSIPPHAEWVIDPDSPRYDDFGSLVGWEENQ